MSETIKRDLDEDDIDFEHCVVPDAAVAGKNKARRRQRETEPFVQVPLWWIELAAKDTRSPATLVLIELLYIAWKTKRSTFPLPNGRLRELGVSRDVKRRILRDLERRPMITVKRRPRKAPDITLVGL